MNDRSALDCHLPLEKFFTNTSRSDGWPNGYCFGFFTDAFDEYDGNNGGLVLVMENVCTRTNVKFYVSSPPLNTFGAPFDRYGPARQLEVEDFAISDMEKYTSSRLFADKKFKELLWSDTYFVESV